MPRCDFNKVALHGCSPVNVLHIFRTSFPRNTYEGLLLITSVIKLLPSYYLTQVL